MTVRRERGREDNVKRHRERRREREESCKVLGELTISNMITYQNPLPPSLLSSLPLLLRSFLSFFVHLCVTAKNERERERINYSEISHSNQNYYQRFLSDCVLMWE